MFIKNPHNPCSRFTEKGLLAKLKRTPGTLKYINDPSKVALHQNGLALQFVEDQTEPIVLKAIKSNPDSKKFVDDIFLYLL